MYYLLLNAYIANAVICQPSLLWWYYRSIFDHSIAELFAGSRHPLETVSFQTPRYFRLFILHFCAMVIAQLCSNRILICSLCAPTRSALPYKFTIRGPTHTITRVLHTRRICHRAERACKYLHDCKRRDEGEKKIVLTRLLFFRWLKITKMKILKRKVELQNKNRKVAG